MSNDTRVDTCPTCGAHSVQACRNDDGSERRDDHAGRPRDLPNWLDITSRAKS